MLSPHAPGQALPPIYEEVLDPSYSEVAYEDASGEHADEVADLYSSAEW